MQHLAGEIARRGWDRLRFGVEMDNYWFSAAAYAAKAGNRDRVFSGYGGWLSSHFLKFRQEVCGITRPKVALHSIRHAYIDATINVGIPDEVSRAIVGHAGKGVHARYGQGAGLKEVATAVAKVDLLA